MFSFDKIISANELLQFNLEEILEQLNEKGELWVFDKNKPQFVIVAPNEVAVANVNILNAKEAFNDTSNGDIVLVRTKFSGMKIGKFVREAFVNLLSANALPQDEIDRLTSPEYSKEAFNMNFSVLREYDPNKTRDIQRCDDKGYTRYYGDLLSAYNKQYLLSSQWFENYNRAKLERWCEHWFSLLRERNPDDKL